jgi:hypothetical protein
MGESEAEARVASAQRSGPAGWRVVSKQKRYPVALFRSDVQCNVRVHADSASVPQ